jgi:hypothetical protein
MTTLEFALLVNAIANLISAVVKVITTFWRKEE